MSQTFRVGQVITAYRKGYHVITAVHLHGAYGRDNVGISYRTIAQRDFKPVTKSPEFYCDATWCRIVQPEELEERIRLVDTWGGDLLQQVIQANE